jgi:hydroxymethylglutaryl-CoA lyase
MADTASVLQQLEGLESNTKLLTIVANTKGAEIAAKFNQVKVLGYPFSISPTFQRRNTNANLQQSLIAVKEIHTIAQASSKELVVYLSMGFGNPYGDAYSYEIVTQWMEKLMEAGVQIISLADTVGMATPKQVEDLCKICMDSYPSIEFGIHLHAGPNNWKAKVDAAFNAGVTRIDSAMKGIGGCPFATDQLVGNIDTELLIPYIQGHQWMPSLNFAALENAASIAAEIFQ